MKSAVVAKKLHQFQDHFGVFYFFDQRTVTEPSSETLLRLAELVLTLNCFSFAGNYYKQINGVASAPPYAPETPPSAVAPHDSRFP